MLAVLAAHSSGLQGQRVMAVENSYAVRLQNLQAEIYMSSLSTRPLGCHMYILFISPCICKILGLSTPAGSLWRDTQGTLGDSPWVAGGRGADNGG